MADMRDRSRANEMGIFGVTPYEFQRAIRGLQYRINLLEKDLMAQLDDLKAAADAAVADLADLRAKVKDLADKLAAVPVPVDNGPAIQAVVDELKAAVAIDAPPAAPAAPSA